MKKILIILLVLVIYGSTFGQEETLISGKIESGGYGAPVVKFTSVKNNFALLVGGYGGWLINHTFLIGGGGYGLVNKIRGDEAAQLFYGYIENIKIEFGYGGVFFEYIANSNNLVHYSISTLIGAGAVNYNHYGNDWGTYLNSWDNTTAATVFVLEPGVHAELNVARFFRINIGASYRVVTGVDIVGLTNKDLSGPAASLSFKFGLF